MKRDKNKKVAAHKCGREKCCGGCGLCRQLMKDQKERAHAGKK